AFKRAFVGGPPRIEVGVTWDADAAATFANIEAADAQELEPGVKVAINDLYKGLKDNGTFAGWKFRLLAGPRTLGGAAVAGMGGTATMVNFVSGDLDRAQGPQGAATKHVLTEWAGDANGQNDFSVFTHVSAAGAGILAGN